MKSNKPLVCAISLSSLIYLGSGVLPFHDLLRPAAVVQAAVFLGLALMAFRRHFAGRLPGKTVLAGLVLCSTGGAAGILFGPPLIMGPVSWGMGLTGTTLFLRGREEDLAVEHRPGGADPDREDRCEAPLTSKEAEVPGAGANPVMVVDDDPACLDTVRAILKRHHIPSLAVKSGEAALAALARGELPGVLLLDIMMPGMSGLEICRRLRKEYPPAELPIIMMTGQQEKDALENAYDAGANDYIAKPFSAAELVARVRCHRDLRQAYHTVRENLRLETEIRLQREMRRSASRAAEREGLEKLRYQLSPHFLFNALAAIRGAVFSDRQAAHDMVTHLSEFCRLTLVGGGDECLTIQKEMAVVGHYLAMEKMRYGDYITVGVEIQPEAESVTIPAFIVQPLVENAIKYGTRTSPDFLDISIVAACRDKDRVLIRVSNSGDWVPPGSGCPEKSTGTGIKNIRARLTRFYGDRFHWEQESGSGSVSISLVLPTRF